MAGNKALRLLLWACFSIPLTLLGQSTAVAQTRDIPMEHHCWGRFPPGAWRTARIVTQSFDEHGKSLGTTTTFERVMLVRIRRGYAILQIESVLEVGGKTFDSPIRIVSQGYHGEEIGNRTFMQELGTGNTYVEGKPISCQVRQYEIKSEDQHKLVKVYYSNKIPPYILRRETIATVGEDKHPTYLNELQVVALDRPHQVFDEIKTTSHLKTTKKNGKSATTILSIHAGDVPGEIVSYRSDEKDDAGKLIRQSTMELVDYGYSAPDEELENTQRRTRRKDKRRNRRHN